MKEIIETKKEELNKVQSSLLDSQTVHRSQRDQMEETLQKDQYTAELLSKENQVLKEAKSDWEKERNLLHNDIRSLEKENDQAHQDAKELKRKIKRLEHILYGRK